MKKKKVLLKRKAMLLGLAATLGCSTLVGCQKSEKIKENNVAIEQENNKIYAENANEEWKEYSKIVEVAYEVKGLNEKNFLLMGLEREYANVTIYRSLSIPEYTLVEVYNKNTNTIAYQLETKSLYPEELNKQFTEKNEVVAVTDFNTSNNLSYEEVNNIEQMKHEKQNEEWANNNSFFEVSYKNEESETNKMFVVLDYEYTEIEETNTKWLIYKNIINPEIKYIRALDASGYLIKEQLYYGDFYPEKLNKSDLYSSSEVLDAKKAATLILKKKQNYMLKGGTGRTIDTKRKK